MAGETFWQNQFTKAASGEAPALTIEQEQERDKSKLDMEGVKTPTQQQPQQPAAQEDTAGIAAMDIPKAAGVGLVGWAESMHEAIATPEARRQVSTVAPALALADYIPFIRDRLAEGAAKGREAFNQAQAYVKESMSADAQKALEAELINENLEFTDDSKKLSTWILKGTETIARMIPDLAIGGMGASQIYKGAYDVALKNGMAKGLSEKGAAIAADKIAKAAMSVPVTATSTLSATGSAGVQARESIESMPWSDLVQSDTFKQQFAAIDENPEYQELSDRQKLDMARTATADIASSKIMKDPALMTVNVMASFLGDATLGRMIAGKMGGGVVSKMATGAIAEAPTEGAQSAMEQYAQNTILMDIAGQELDPMKGVVRSAAEGALLGAAVGGTVGGVAGGAEAVRGRGDEPLVEGVEPEQKPVEKRRQELESRLEAQREELTRERVAAGETEVQKALEKGEMAPTPEELIARAPEQIPEWEAEAARQKEEFAKGRAAPTVAERKANLERRLEEQRREYERQRVERGEGEVQARLSQPAMPTPEELLIKAADERGPTPGELAFREQSDLDYIQKMKDAKIPEGLKGKPIASRMMNKGYRAALSDYSNLSRKITPAKEPEPKTDTMAEVLAKMGGINRNAAEQDGFDPATMKGNRAFTKKGMTFDDAAERLNELGYRNRQGNDLDANDVSEMLNGEVNNAERHYSTMADPELLTADAALMRSFAKRAGGYERLSATIDKALAGEKLSKPQSEIIEDMLEDINAMRRDIAEDKLEELQQARESRRAARTEEFNNLFNQAVAGDQQHLSDADAYESMLSEMPDTYTEEQVILDELVSSAGDVDFAATSTAIEQYESGAISLPDLLFKLSDISEQGVTRDAETEQAIQEIREPAAKPIERGVEERIGEIEAETAGEPAAVALSEAGAVSEAQTPEQVDVGITDKDFADMRQEVRRLADDPGWEIGGRADSFQKRINQVEDMTKGRADVDPDLVNWARDLRDGIREEEAAKAKADEEAYAVAQQMIKEGESRRKAESEKLKAGKSENPRTQAYLDTLDDPAEYTNAGYMSWIGQRSSEFKKTKGTETISDSMQDEFTNYIKQYADDNKAARLQHEKASKSQVEKLKEIGNDFFRGLDNVNKTAARKALKGEPVTKADAEQAIAQHEAYLERRKAEGEQADKERFEKADALYGDMSREELDAELSRLQGTGYVEGEVSDGRRSTRKAVTNEASRGKAEQAMLLERYIKDKFSDQPAPEPAAETDYAGKSVDDWKAISKQGMEGDLPPAQYVAAAEAMLADKDRIIADIEKAYTKPQILKQLGPMAAYRAKSEKKGFAAKELFRGLIGRFYLGDVLSYGGLGKDSYENAVIEEAKKLTPDKISNYKIKLAKRRDEAKAKFAATAKALKDPETLAEFSEFVSVKGESALTVDQRAKYDRLLTDASMKKSASAKESQAVTKGLQVENGVEVLSMEPGKNSKTGEPLINIKLSNLGKDKFKEVAARARKMGGGYWKGNFWMPDQYKADQLVAWAKGETIDTRKELNKVQELKQKATTKKLTALADKLESDANERLNAPRRENTYRQMSMADSARSKAENDIRTARMLRAIVDGVDDGSITYLSGITSKAQLDSLDKMAKSTIYNVPEDKRDTLFNKDNQARYSWKESITPEQKAAFAQYPLIQSRGFAVNDWASRMMDIKGFKQAAQSIKKSFARFDRELIELDTKAPYFAKLVEYLKTEDRYSGKSALEDFNRLQRMGITNLPALRTALIELDKVNASIGSPAQKTTVQKLERDLMRKIRLNRNAFNDFFPTPATFADDVAELADIKPGMKVLEPSAGNGELATAAQRFGADVDTVELAADLRDILNEKGFNVLGDDFLNFKSAPDYDRILMNPPFSNDQDIDHIAHAFNMLKPGGRLVAITSSMAGDRANGKNRRFREWLDSLGAEERYLPDDAFLDSMNPTGVKTKTIVIDKPDDPGRTKQEQNLVSFSKDSIVSGKPSGVSAKEADIVANSFLKKYKGAAGVKVVVFPTQQEAFNYAGIEAPDGATIGGMHVPMTGEVIIVAENMHDIRHVTNTLRHEILAHHGLFRVVGQNEWEAVTNLVSASRDADSLKKIWEQVDHDYRGFSEEQKAEEVIARIAEHDPGKLGEWGNRIMAAVIRALRKVGFINDRVTETEIKDMIRIIGERMKNLSRADARIRNDINFSRQLTGNTGFSIPDETRTDAFLRSISDKYQRLKVVQKAVKEQGGAIAENADAYLAEELFHGKVGEDLRVMDVDYIQPLQEYMAGNDVDISELDLYLIAKHAPERNKQIAKINPKLQDGGSGMTNQEAADIISRFNAEGKLSNLEAAAGFVYGMLNQTKQRLVDSGLETQDAIDSWDASYDHYVPLKGFAEDETDQDGNVVKAVGKGFNIRGKETMRAMGRRSLPASPTAYAISDATQSIVRARKNEVAQSMLRLVDANPDPDLWQVFSADNPDMTRRIVRKKDPLTGKTVETVVETPMPMHAMKDQYLGVKMSGEQYYIKLHDPRLMEAMANLGVEQSNVLTQTVGRVTRILSALITSYNPEFMFSNFARDVQTAVYNLMAETEVKDGKAEGLKELPKEVVKSLPDSMKALKRGFRDNDFSGQWGSYLKEYLDSGAKTGWFVQKDIDEIKSDMQKMLERTGPGAKNALMRSKDKLLKFVDDYNDVVENSSRLATYFHARELGMSKAKAASLAKNLTVNFNRRGQMSNSLNALYMFFNASVQGTANMLRAVATPKDKSKSMFDPRFYNTTQKIAMALPIATMFMAAANRELGGDDDDGKAYYDKIPNYLKETNFILMIPGSEGDYIKIPMPYGYNFFSAIGTAIDNSINGEASAVEGAFDIAASFAGAFSPLGHTDSKEMSVQVLKMASPTLLKPFVEMAVNENFSGSPIYKQQNPFGLTRPDAYNAQRRTWEWAKGVSEWLNDATGGNQFKSGIVDIAPESWQHMISFMGGGLGTLFGRSQDLSVKVVKGEEVESRDIPFFRKYFASISDSVDVAEFYQRLEDLQVVEKQATGLPKDERLAFRKENKGKIRMLPMSQAVKKELQKLNRLRNDIEASKSLSEEQKKQRIDKIEETKRRLTSRFNAKYNETVGK